MAKNATDRIILDGNVVVVAAMYVEVANDVAVGGEVVEDVVAVSS